MLIRGIIIAFFMDSSSNKSREVTAAKTQIQAGKGPNSDSVRVASGRVLSKWMFWLLSLLLHALLVIVAQYTPQPATSPEEARIEPIKLRFRDAARPQQIVDLDQAEKKPLKETDLLAPKDAAAHKETVAMDAGPTSNKAQPAQKPEAQQKPIDTRQGDRKKLEALIPKMAQLLPGQISRQSNYIERNKGPVTLLNAKASPYAEYFINAGHRTVRYLNVNGALMNWYLQDVQRLNFPAQVNMKINRTGSVIESTIQTSSGSGKVDRWFYNAIRSGFSSQPPPVEMFSENKNVVLIVGQLHADHIAVGLP